MKRLIIAVGVLACFGLAGPASAGDHHSGTSLICSDCHTAHFSNQHGYTVGDPTPYLGTGPNDYLLRDDTNNLCLSCHNNESTTPDVFGTNTGLVSGNRVAGALNAAPGHLSPGAGYDDIDGHTLWSTATAPGGTFNNPNGLECIDCHSQHGQNVFQYRNLQYSTTASNKFYNKLVDYAIGTNDPTKAVFETPVAASYAEANIWYNEPDATKSAMADWCASCHTNFHGAGGSANMGGVSGGYVNGTSPPWHRHPTADVYLGHAGEPAFIASLAQYLSHTNRVKVMDPDGHWDATSTRITPSCMSCHKSHVNQNGFGLIYMTGSGTTVTEEGDGGVYKDLCRQCHVQGG